MMDHIKLTLVASVSNDIYAGESIKDLKFISMFLRYHSFNFSFYYSYHAAALFVSILDS